MFGFEPLHFVFVVPTYNNELYAQRNLESLIEQETDHSYSIIVINDCSTDNTGKVLEDFKEQHQLNDMFLKIIHNPTRRGALSNIYTTIHEQCTKDQIVVLVDGDDTLAHSQVLNRLAQEYEDKNVWMTYGQFVFYPDGPGGRLWGTTYEISQDDQIHRRIRNLVYVAQHPRTFRVPLFLKIQEEHLKLDGKFFEMNADMATMIPMLEMASPKKGTAQSHSVFIPDILYIYNYDNPINDHKVNRALQLSLEEVIRAIPPYEPLDSLD